MKMNNNNDMKIVPKFIYPNAETYKFIIYDQNNKKSGIYRWVNLISGKSYVGSSVNLTKRLGNYYSLNYLKNSLKKNPSIIYRSLLKQGYSNFSLEILEYCEPNLLTSREQYYIDLLKPEYNILKIAGSRLGTKHTK